MKVSDALYSAARALFACCVLAGVALFSCATDPSENDSTREADRLAREERLGKGRVALNLGEDGYYLTVDGTEFFAKGVGLGPGTGYSGGVSDEFKQAVDRVAEAGGNAIRTWSYEYGKEILDYCQTKNIMVCMGLWVQHERHGFDYNNAAAVAAQMETFRAAVMELKDHPALLAWGVGNEVETEATNMRVWDAVNDISKMIHEIDGNHPTMYVVADYFDPVVADISNRLSDIDIIGVNSYANLGNCLARWDSSAEKRPILVTEWGPSGWWEAPTTAWGAPIEPVSGVRLEQYRDNYKYIAQRSGRVLGSFAFYWGQKQERTYTWFSLALESGLLTEAADALTYKWTGSWPSNRAPHLTAVTVNGVLPASSLSVAPSARLIASATVSDPDGDVCTGVWTVREETTATSVGGDAEAVPEEVSVEIVPPAGGPIRGDSFEFFAPAAKGSYRLFVEVTDGRGKVATANFPFRVEAPASE